MKKKLLIKVIYSKSKQMKFLNSKYEKNVKKKRILNEEFKSLGFYISDHPLNNYKNIFEQHNVLSLKNIRIKQK